MAQTGGNGQGGRPRERMGTRRRGSAAGEEREGDEYLRTFPEEEQTLLTTRASAVIAGERGLRLGWRLGCSAKTTVGESRYAAWTAR